MSNIESTASIDRGSEYLDNKPESTQKEPDSNKESGQSPQAVNLIELTNDIDVFHNESGETFASIKIDKHIENWSIDSRQFKDWLSHKFYQKYKRPPGHTALQDALGTIRGKALYEGGCHQDCCRIAKCDDDIYIDLCDESWNVIKVNSEGWTILDKSPVKFRRTSSMRALPTPKSGGSLDPLWDFVNINNDNDKKLITAWMVDALRPDTDYIILVFEGEQGSAKSTIQSRIRSIIDPSKANLRTAPTSVEDIFVSASNNWVVSYNNASHLSRYEQNAFCQLSTGGGYSARTLYTNLDESTADIQRPIMLNGINTLPTEPDMIDRCITIYLPLITDTRRKTDTELNQKFEKEYPYNKRIFFIKL